MQSTDKLTRADKFILNSMGDEILKYLDDDTVNEVYVNDDYKLRLDTIYGRKCLDTTLDEIRVKSICEAIAGVNQDIISEESPMLGVELITLQLRAQINYPPVCRRPIFHLRKKPRRIFTLEEYVEAGSLTENQLKTICELIKNRKNIVVVGGTGSGKTTFLNGMLKKLAELNPEHRLLILEDLPELQSSSEDAQNLRTSGNKSTKVTMKDLVYICMRMSPDRIIVGEVRDGTAHDMLKAWNTGHEGGFCTIHANSTENAFVRLEGLMLESDQVPSMEVAKYNIGVTVGAIISIQKMVGPTGTKRLIDDIIVVDHYDLKKEEYVFTHV